jgi:uncharacterized repeat protein (TIGR03803 family)
MRNAKNRVKSVRRRHLLDPLESRVMMNGATAEASVLAPLIPGRNGDGSVPAGLVVDANGNLFGETSNGGRNGKGTLYEIKAGTHSVTVLFSFTQAEGAHPFGQLAVNAEGDLFGVTQGGGTDGHGVLFEWIGGDTLTDVKSFTAADGRPTGALAFDSAGNLWGATGKGKNSGGLIFHATFGGAAPAFSDYGNFAKGITPGPAFVAGAAGPLAGQDGGVYGTASGSGNSEVFNVGGPFAIPAIVIPGGTSSDIVEIATGATRNVGRFTGGIQQDANDNIFVTTTKNGRGSLLEAANGSQTFTSLASFGSATGRVPTDALVLNAAGNLFGTTNGGAGGVWEYTMNGNKELLPVATFNKGTGHRATSELAIANDVLYGATATGGAHGDGTVFDVSLSPIIADPPTAF